LKKRNFPGLDQFGRAIQLVWSSSRGYALASLVVVLVQAVLSVAALVLLKKIIDAVTNYVTEPLPESLFGPVAVLIAAASLVALFTALLSSVDTAIAEIHADLVRDHMHGMVHAKATAVDLAYYENTEYFNTLHRVQVEAPERATKILSSLLQIGRASVTLVAIGGLLFYFHWWIAVLLILGDLPGAFVRLRAAWLTYRWERDSTSADRRARYFSILLSTRYVAQEVRLFGLGDLFADRFRTIRQRLREERKSLVRRRVSADAIAQIGAAIAMFFVYGFIAYQALNGVITLGDVAMYFAAFQRGRGLLRELLFGMARSYENSLFLSEFSEFLALEQHVLDPDDPIAVPVPLRKGVVFNNVGFRYPGAQRPALERIDLTVKPGECIAIVGRTGSGKTTLVKLLCRMYDPTTGDITVDDVALQKLSKQQWLHGISAYFQESGKYYLAARENIAFGDLEKSNDETAIMAAARRSGAHEVISNLQSGYDTVLGTVLEQGSELSMGEWQKVALARTYLRDARILVLDEPTNAMDALSEQQALEAIWDAAPDCIRVLISHRLSAVRRADRVYMLSHGRIAESGTHEDLMKNGDKYAEMFDAQARYYR
jgi:ATP-binding cassette subfamily B protein